MSDSVTYSKLMACVRWRSTFPGVPLGYKIVIFPISTLLAATAAMRRILQEIARTGTPAAAMQELPAFAEFVDFIGLPQVREAEQRYAVRPAPGPGTGGRNGSDV